MMPSSSSSPPSPPPPQARKWSTTPRTTTTTTTTSTTTTTNADGTESRGSRNRRMAISHSDNPHNNNHDNDDYYYNHKYDATAANRKKWVGGFLAGGMVVSCLALTAPFVLGMIQSPLPYMATPGRKLRQALEFVIRRIRISKQPPPPPPQHSTSTSSSAMSLSPSPRLVFVDLGSGDGEGVYQAVRAGYHLAVGIERNTSLYGLSQVRRWCFWTRTQRRASQFYCRNFLVAFPPLVASVLLEATKSSWSSSSSLSLSSSQPSKSLLSLWSPQFHLINQQNNHDATTSPTTTTTPTTTRLTVLIFGVTPLMPTISGMLAQHCPPGTHILAYRFPLPLLLSDNANTSTTTTTTPKKNATTKDTSALAASHDNRGNEHEEPPRPPMKLVKANLVYDVEEMRIYEVVE